MYCISIILDVYGISIFYFFLVMNFLNITDFLNPRIVAIAIVNEVWNVTKASIFTCSHATTVYNIRLC